MALVRLCLGFGESSAFRVLYLGWLFLTLHIRRCRMGEGATYHICTLICCTIITSLYFVSILLYIICHITQPSFNNAIARSVW